MTNDPLLLERLRTILNAKQTKWAEKKMIGGDCFMVDDKMCFGTYKGGLMVRINPREAMVLGIRKGASAMVLGGKTMKGYIFVEPAGYEIDADLLFWIEKCLEFNPLAKSTKRK